MKQKIVTIFKDFKPSGNFNLDDVVSQANTQGYIVKQIVTTSVHSANPVSGGIPMPRIAITLLLEKEN